MALTVSRHDLRQIVTYSGRYVTTIEGTPSIEDVALALCRTPMFVGQTEDFFSLAHHSLHTAHILPAHRVYGLIHEAYVSVLGACPGILQDAEYRRFSIQVMRAFCNEHDLAPYDKPMRAKVLRADSIAAAAAARVCGLPKVDEFFPMTKDVMEGMAFVRQLIVMYPPEAMLKPNSPLQRYFIVKFQEYLAFEIELQQTPDKDGDGDGGDNFLED